MSKSHFGARARRTPMYTSCTASLYMALRAVTGPRAQKTHLGRNSQSDKHLQLFSVFSSAFIFLAIERHILANHRGLPRKTTSLPRILGDILASVLLWRKDLRQKCEDVMSCTLRTRARAHAGDNSRTWNLPEIILALSLLPRISTATHPNWLEW